MIVFDMHSLGSPYRALQRIEAYLRVGERGGERNKERGREKGGKNGEDTPHTPLLHSESNAKLVANVVMNEAASLLQSSHFLCSPICIQVTICVHSLLSSLSLSLSPSMD